MDLGVVSTVVPNLTDNSVKNFFTVTGGWVKSRQRYLIKDTLNHKGTLSAVVRKFKKQGFFNYFTNHSFRATYASRLYDESVDEQLILEVTGNSLMMESIVITGPVVITDRRCSTDRDCSEISFPETFF